LLLTLGESAWVGGFLKALVPGWKLVLRSGFLLPLAAFLLAVTAMKVLHALLEGMVRPRLAGGLALSVAVLSLGTLLPAAWDLRWTLPGSYYREPAALGGYFYRSRARVCHSPSWSEGPVRLTGATREEAYQGGKERLLPNWNLTTRLGGVMDYNSFGLRAPRDWRRGVFRVSRSVSRGALDFLGARLIVGATDLPGLTPGALGSVSVPHSVNPTAYGPWFAAREGRRASGMAEDWSSLDRMGADFRTVFVEGFGAAEAFTERPVTFEQGLNRVLVTAQGAGRALLASSETAAPGWKVRVHGALREALVVHHAFRGVVLEGREWKARWSYEPATFRLGCFLSLVSVAALLAWTVPLLAGPARRFDRMMTRPRDLRGFGRKGRA
jgi:hypothetical protein